MNQECCDGQVENILNESKCGYKICRAYGLKFYYNPKEYKCISKSGKDTFERIYIENSFRKVSFNNTSRFNETG